MNLARLLRRSNEAEQPATVADIDSALKALAREVPNLEKIKAAADGIAREADGIDDPRFLEAADQAIRAQLRLNAIPGLRADLEAARKVAQEREKQQHIADLQRRLSDGLQAEQAAYEVEAGEHRAARAATLKRREQTTANEAIRNELRTLTGKDPVTDPYHVGLTKQQTLDACSDITDVLLNLDSAEGTLTRLEVAFSALSNARRIDLVEALKRIARDNDPVYRQEWLGNGGSPSLSKFDPKRHLRFGKGGHYE